MKIKTRTIRKASQIIFLLAFFWFFIATRFPLETPATADLFTRFSPLVAVAAMLASRAFIALLIPGLVLLGLSLLLGRFFCGWVCPLGTTIDISDNVIARFKKVPVGNDKKLRWIKYSLLGAILVFAALGYQAAGFFDPLTLYPRTLATAVSPYANHLTRGAFDLMHLVPGLGAVSEAVYGPVKNTFLEFQPTWFNGHLLFFAIFVGILLLGLVRKRFWCRYVCPMGAMLGLTRTGLLLRRRVDQSCVACGKCAHVCPMGAIADDKGTILAGECTICGNCTGICPKGSTRFALIGTGAKAPVPAMGIGMTRRQLVGGLAVGVVAAPVAAAASRLGRGVDVIRPPGALPPGEFEARCVRCGECMKVCLTGGLQPIMLQKGIEGLWTPALTPRIGYCEYNCNLCGAVCPTDAIHYLDLRDKQRTPIGYAGVDRTRCLPWAYDTECLVCEEHCPVEPKKAIKLEPVEITEGKTGEKRTILRPHVCINKCIGCGICENKCPVPGMAAIRVRGADSETIAQLRGAHQGKGQGGGQGKGQGQGNGHGRGAGGGAD